MVSSLGHNEGFHQYFLRYFVNGQSDTQTQSKKPHHAKHVQGLIKPRSHNMQEHHCPTVFTDRMSSAA